MPARSTQDSSTQHSPTQDSMMMPVKQALRRVLARSAPSNDRAYETIDARAVPIDLQDESLALWERVRSRTMTSIERIDALRRAVEHIHANDIGGDVVECGVWRGGSMMAVALTLERLGARRPLWLYDTFSGMTPPRSDDVDVRGRAAADLLATEDPEVSRNWARSPVADAQQALTEAGYPGELAHFVVGPVEETIPRYAPSSIALLRLDTDWFQSTYHELVHLWPRVIEGGIVIVDDYGHWAGAKKAVDQYFSEQKLRPFLHRIDYTGRLIIKSRSLSQPVSRFQEVRG
jgi:O-methyltransferase